MLGRSGEVNYCTVLSERHGGQIMLVTEKGFENTWVPLPQRLRIVFVTLLVLSRWQRCERTRNFSPRRRHCQNYDFLWLDKRRLGQRLPKANISRSQRRLVMVKTILKEKEGRSRHIAGTIDLTSFLVIFFQFQVDVYFAQYCKYLALTPLNCRLKKH